MSKLRIEASHEHLIAVLGPRYKGNYSLVLPGVIKSIDTVESDATETKSGFVLVHDGVTSGITGEVMEAVNKTQPGLRNRGRMLSMRKLALDIELHGKDSHFRWVDDVLTYKPDLFLLFDNGEWEPVRYAVRKAAQLDIPIKLIKIRKEQL
ncbi:hypothetical protein FDI69_gp192 [Rhodococcus phage Trina]|uniref:Uncharacterized protein n=1 Tax=Rhodococcus phage Trina TaxID=2027905 RepID=A0A2D1ADU9_9CAUD|nr:hypothetical protein FDI69_gp192 [Rhodococcus phage Trina]ASZ74994.1 hypothetical protein SEA_TRINA_215 [Rhodococcus phage Trina]